MPQMALPLLDDFLFHLTIRAINNSNGQFHKHFTVVSYDRSCLNKLSYSTRQPLKIDLVQM